MNSFKKGIRSGLQTTWALGKIIFPITLLVTIISHTAIIQWLMKALTPMMSWIGLPGDAAIPIVLGNFLNLYAGIGAILTMELTVKEVFILAVMLSFSHNLIIESTVASRVGVSFAVMASVRVFLAVSSAFLIHLFWKGGSETASYGFLAPTEDVSGWGAIIMQGLEKAFVGSLQLALIVIPLMVMIQYMKDWHWLETFSRWMMPITKSLGMEKNTSTTLAAGLLFGLAYGAGVMIQAVKEDGVAKKDLYLAFIFLVSCHAVIEDTLIFIPLGIPVWPLLLIRLIIAIILTVVIAAVWRKYEKRAKYKSEGTS
jgi:hypothetical protein